MEKERAPSRASGSRSPAKRPTSSTALNPLLPRPPSYTSRVSTTSTTSSPTKKASSRSTPNTPIRPRTTITQAATPKVRPRQATMTPRKASDADPETSDNFSASASSSSDGEGADDMPVRRLDFTPRKQQPPVDLGASTSSIVEYSSASPEDSEDQEDDLDSEGGKRENVVVCLRVRPSRNGTGDGTGIYDLSPEKGTIGLSESHPTFVKRGAMAKGGAARDEYEFRFDALHLSPKPTEDLYESKVRPVVRAAMKGFNGTVFAYGQTASGKTHTMMGTEDEPGVIPLAIGELFNYIHHQDTKRSFSLRVSFLEIYNETLQDLLRPASSGLHKPSKPLEVHGDDGSVKGLEERPVSMPEEVLSLLQEGQERRRTGATDWNERSSRSHCVFTVTIESMSKTNDGVARTSRLNLIDLAGSESATGQEERRKEGSHINKSLLTLGTVIGKLTEKSTGAQHIPFRDSKLTRLLQPALSGKSRVTVICTISPNTEHATESLSTLKFAKRAKMVVTKAERGVLVTNPDQMMLSEYQKQVAMLQAQIAARESDTLPDDGLAEEELASKELELARLRELLDHTKSFILTGPVLEANARRVSGQFGPGSRSVSMMSPMRSLGYGTPRGSQQSLRMSSASTISSIRVASDEKELELKRQLEEAERKLVLLAEQETELSTLRSQLGQLQRSTSMARLDAEKSAAANADRKQELKNLQRELDVARDQLSETSRLSEDLEHLRQTQFSMKKELEIAQASLEEARNRSTDESNAKIEALRKELHVAKEEVLRLLARLAKTDHALEEAEAAAEQSAKATQAIQDRLSASEEESRSTSAKLATAEKSLAEAEARSRALEHKLVAAKGPDKRDDKIRGLEHEISFLKKELTSLTIAKTTGIQAAESVSTELRSERDAAAELVRETADRLRQVEEQATLRQEQHDASSREKDVAVRDAQSTIAELRRQLAVLEERLATLEQLEAQRKTYVVNQRAGTDALRDRMHALTERRSVTPTQLASSSVRPGGSARPPSRTSSNSSSVRSSASTVSLESFVKLQAQNTDLAMRLDELRQASATPQRVIPSPAFSDPKETERLNTMIKSQSQLIVEAQRNAAEWQRRFEELERSLDRQSSRRSDENQAPTPVRPSLKELNALASSSERSSSAYSDRKASSSPAPRYRHTPALSSPSIGAHPPPLPASPITQDSMRKMRRETIAKDMAKLKELPGVARKKEMLDSPSSQARQANWR